MALPRRLIAFALASAAAAGLPAEAGIPLRDPAGILVRWDLITEQPNVQDGVITYLVDPKGSGEAVLGDQSERDAIDASFTAWMEALGPGIGFHEDPLRPAFNRNANDRVNFVAWQDHLLGPFTLAATFASSNNGVLVDADTIFNDTPEFVSWATTTPGTPGYADIQAVATHEIGHLLGIDHSPVQGATMGGVQPIGTIYSRTIEPDDIGAAIESYPVLGSYQTGSILGRVRVGRRKAPRGVVVVAFDARTGEAVASCLSSEEGRYRLLALPPGPYLVAGVPMGSTAPYAIWWEDAPRNVLPAWRGTKTAGGWIEPEFVTVRAGFPEANRDLVLQKSRASTTGEPDDAPFEARELAPGGAVVGAFEEPLDEDWFVLEADGLGGLEFRLRATGIGSAADPEMAIFAADGTTLLAQNVDRRPAIFPENLHGEMGPDRDPLITAFLPPGPGRLYVRVRAQQGSESGYPGCFYVLHVVTGKGVPDAGRTTAVLDPPATRTGDGPDVTLRVVPRDYFGDPIGPGASISVNRDDGGPGFTLDDVGGGTYEAVIPPPASPGEVRFSIVVDAPLGDGAVADAATLVVAGPADAAHSILGLEPRRVEIGGASATLVYEPRDAEGRPLGAGLLVAFAFDGAPAGTLGAAVDRGDGTYAAELLSPDAPGSARVAVVSGGVPTGLARIVGFGWDLPLVAADLGAETTEALGLPGLSRGEELRFARAAEALDALADALATGSLEDAAAAAARATAALHRGPHLIGGADGPAAAVDLAEALRRRVRARIDAIVLPVPDPSGQRVLGRARALLDRAEEVLAAGNAVAGARLLAAAARRAAPLP